MGLIENYTAVALVLSALAPVVFKFLRRPGGYLALGLMVAGVIYRHQFFGYVLWIGLLFAFAKLVERVTPQTTKGSGKTRWTYSCAAMLTVIAIFFAGSLHLLDRVSIRAFGVLWTLPDHDMWLLLRTIAFLWEFGSGRLKKVGFVDYVIWITFPFTLLGPLIRPSEFFAQYARSEPPPPLSPVLDQSWYRKLILAMVQMLVAVVLVWATHRIENLGPHWPKVFILFGTAPWSSYLSTAGVFHLMEALALLWAIELPPSFNYPFGQVNISEFWARWNMTIVRVCRDYLFYNRWGLKKVSVYFNTMMVFFAVGLWHNANLYWGTWGILHGIGFCAYLWYRTHKEQFAFANSIGSQRVRKIASAGATYVFVCLCWYVATKIALMLHHGPIPNSAQ